MVERFFEIFMDDFSGFGDSFDQCHFMVKQGIVLGYIISNKCI